jgi:hypothetical protein
MWELVKLSDPGWEKTFATRDEATSELRKHICSSCMAGSREYVQLGGGVQVEDVEPAPDPNDADALLGTACGCEFYLYDLQKSD